MKNLPEVVQLTPLDPWTDQAIFGHRPPFCEYNKIQIGMGKTGLCKEFEDDTTTG